jgi:hypothetical protein
MDRTFSARIYFVTLTQRSGLAFGPRRKQKQIPCGNDRKKGKSKCQYGGLSAAAQKRAFGRDDKFVLGQDDSAWLVEMASWFGHRRFDLGLLVIFDDRCGNAAFSAQAQVAADKGVEVAVEHLIDVADFNAGAEVFCHAIRLQDVAADL